MVNFKKMDEKDFVFVSKTLSDKEEKEFSDFLKLRKTKTKFPKKLEKANEILSTAKLSRSKHIA